MDHYTAEAYEKVRLKIVENIDRLEAYRAKFPGKKPGSGDIHNLKNWKRFGAGFAWDPEVYVDIMKNPDMSDAELMSSLRKTESNLMKKWAVVDKMPMHHKIALRTGGDLGLRTPVNIWMETRKRLYDRFGFDPGNGPANLNATSQFNEGIHLQRQNAAGSPLRKTEIPETVLQEIKTNQVGLHRAGQKLGELPELYEPLIGASAKDQAAYLEEYIVGQLDRFEDARNYPRVKQANDTLNDGLSWFLTDKDGGKIDAFSDTQTLKDQPVIKAVNEATSYKDPRTGEVFTLDELHGKGFVGSGKVNISPEDLTLDFTSRKGKKAFKLIEDHGGYRLKQFIPGALEPVIGIGGKLIKPVGALLDAGSAFAGTTGALDENKTGLQKTASTLDATSGALGLGSLLAPALGPLSVGAGLIAAGDQTAPDIANAVAPYVPTPALYANENSTGDVGRDAGIAISNAAKSVGDFVTQDFGVTEFAERTAKRGIEWIKGIPRFAITY